MNDLVEFLLARFAEDAEEARVIGEWIATKEPYAAGSSFVLQPYEVEGVFYPSRVLAEVGAKRQLVEELARMLRDEVGWDDIEYKVMGYLALPYADHKDYREEWRP